MEIRDDGGNWECDAENAANRAKETDEFARSSSRVHVAVSDSRHRDNGPPKRMRNRAEVVFALFAEVDKSREEHHRNYK